MTALKPDQLLRTLLHHWFLLFIGAVLGGLVGLGITKLQPSVYEASSLIHIAIDPNRAQPLSPTLNAQALDHVRALLISDDTLQAAMERMAQNVKGPLPFTSPAEFRSSVKLAQQDIGFKLIVYADEADLAANYANAWARAGITALETAYVHAIKASELQNSIYQVGCSLKLRKVGDTESAVWTCKSKEEQSLIDDIPELLLEEVMKSKGILPAYTFSLSQLAQPPTKPILWHRSALLIAGLIVGFLSGLAVVIGLGGRIQGNSIGADYR